MSRVRGFPQTRIQGLPQTRIQGQGVTGCPPALRRPPDCFADSAYPLENTRRVFGVVYIITLWRRCPLRVAPVGWVQPRQPAPPAPPAASQPRWPPPRWPPPRWPPPRFAVLRFAVLRFVQSVALPPPCPIYRGFPRQPDAVGSFWEPHCLTERTKSRPPVPICGPARSLCAINPARPVGRGASGWAAVWPWLSPGRPTRRPPGGRNPYLPGTPPAITSHNLLL